MVAKITTITSAASRTDDRIGRRRNGEIQHRPGFDITFSAPKSVSMAALVFGDKRILEAHNTDADEV